MFTGIVEEIGEIVAINESPKHYSFHIKASHILEDVKLGDSIAINGVCLTVTSFTSSQFTVDVMPETVKATNLSAFKKGTKVNLERAMQMNNRFGGHFVSGHVEVVGKIIRTTYDRNAKYYEIELPSVDWMPYIAEKGSITVDGTSLTVFEVNEQSFLISLIPHTRQATILGEKDVGDSVNIECDMLMKYLSRLLQFKEKQPKKKSSITLQDLSNYGFLD